MTGRELRRIRLRLGLTQARMAKLLGIARDSVGRYERGAAPITKLVEFAVLYLGQHGGPGR